MKKLTFGLLCLTLMLAMTGCSFFGFGDDSTEMSNDSTETIAGTYINPDANIIDGTFEKIIVNDNSTADIYIKGSEGVEPQLDENGEITDAVAPTDTVTINFDQNKGEFQFNNSNDVTFNVIVTQNEKAEVYYNDNLLQTLIYS